MIEHRDVIVLGAGLSGMYALHKLREFGFRPRAYEAGGGVGGTWYWNRYPGARFDSESWTYIFSFDPELLREWTWSEHFAGQPENLRYCNFVADKLDLRRDITFGERAKAAHWDEAANEWEVAFESALRVRARFVVTAIGPLSAPTMPLIDGIDGMDAMSGIEESSRTLEIRGAADEREGQRFARISVQDHGVGLLAEQVDRLFEPFFTTKAHGMGLGLAISHSIIEAHGGSLWAETNQGPGATFSFCVPAVPSQPGS